VVLAAEPLLGFGGWAVKITSAVNDVLPAIGDQPLLAPPIFRKAFEDGSVSFVQIRTLAGYRHSSGWFCHGHKIKQLF
jgi:hypothetical protein